MKDELAELSEVADRLRRERPQASELELDRVKVRAMRRASRESPGFLSRKKGSLMRARFAVTAVVIVGVLVALSGATVMQLDGGDAASHQYETAADFVIDLSGGVPENITITAGQTILFTNGSGEVHTVTKENGGDGGPGPSFDSGEIASGESYSRTFVDAGEIRYFSTTDVGESDEQDFTGTITVRSAD